MERWYRLAIELNPNNADALGALAQWLMTHDHFFEAESYFASARELDRERLSRYVDFAAYYAVGEDMDRVREIGEEIRTRFPNARGDLALARLYETTGELDIGIAYGLRAYRASPENPDNAGQVAELYARIGLFEEADEFEPETSLPYLLYFRRDYPRLRDEASERMFENPNELRLQYMLAFAYNALDDPENAIFVLENAGLPIEPGAEFLTSHTEEAMDTYIDALQAVDPNSAKARDFATRREGPEIFEVRLWQSWWGVSRESCRQAQLGNFEQALVVLERIKLSQGLPVSPFLQDALCFRPLADNPRYKAVLEHLEARQAALRARLPATLQAYGVADVRAVAGVTTR